MIVVKGKYTKAKIMIDQVDESCMAQINTFVNHAAFTKPVAIMPDTHAGKGSVIGFTMELTDKVIPNVIGVDIGCGMCSVNVGRSINLSFEELDRKIRKRVPFGFAVHGTAVISVKNDFPWHQVNVLAEKFALAYREKFNAEVEPPRYNQDWFLDKADRVGASGRRAINSIGTLGGGNHFIETGIADNGDFWITVHSGSRNFGKRVCEYWQSRAVKKQGKMEKNLAKQQLAKLRDAGDYHGMKERKRQKRQQTADADGGQQKGLEWLEGAMAAEYLFDMIFAQMYAQVNRKCIIDAICDILKITPQDRVETIHNYIDFKDFIIRKGAVASYSGERIIIPFNMRDGLLIAEGKSNKEWNFSAPHGAGRVMSRHEAKRRLDVSTFQQQMAGIFSTSVGRSTLDECPDSYKDASVIEQAIADTAAVLFKVKPLHNMKDTSGSD
ncbi:MAG: RtcB family protein [Chitinivibrionales bacterium]|nr:RtcB family protein [Chitinivibrionales bacterium]